MLSDAENTGPGRIAPSERPVNFFARAWVQRGLTVLLLMATGWMLATAWTEFRAEFPYLAAQDRAKRWTEGSAPLPTEAAWKQVLAELHHSEKVRPESPVLQELLGSMYLLGSQQEWQPDAQRLAWADQALVHYRHSLKLRPTDGMTWALLGMALGDARSPAPQLAEAALKALKLAPNDNHVQLVLMHLAVRHWDVSPAELQTWATNLFESGTAAQRYQINTLAKAYGLEFSSETAPR
jgi:tetratricopeptide (TPR) repeat protein